MAVRTFALFGPTHLATLGLITAAVGLVVFAARGSARPAALLRRGLAALLLASGLAVLTIGRLQGAAWRDLAPLHLCDAAVLVGAWALLTLRPLAIELTYFWSAGSLLALLTPDLAVGPADPMFWGYFVSHGGVVAAGLLLTLGLGHIPRVRAPFRAFLWTNAYAAVVLLVDIAFSANFLYLLAKPATPTPLDWFGPWPIYIAVAEVAALGLFCLMALPFRRASPTRNQRREFTCSSSPRPRSRALGRP